MKKGLLATCAVLISPGLVLCVALAKGGPREGNDPAVTLWFKTQHNMDGGWCCELADGHRLEQGDVRFDAAINKWFVRLPDQSWRMIQDWQLRHPEGGANPVGHPVLWYNLKTENGSPYYQIWCFDPNVLV